MRVGTRQSARAAGTPRGRSARIGSAFILFALALVAGLSACGSAMPADTPPPQADLLSIIVTEHHSGISPPVEHVIFSQQFSDQATISAVQRALLTISLEKPDTSYNCPAGTPIYDTYYLRFTQQGSLVEYASVDARDCATWHITTRKGNVSRLLAPSSFWDHLHSVTGAPLPIRPQP